MKNIQVIDGALNCTFSFFQATDEEFLLLFPDPRQDIQYAEDLPDLPMQDEINPPYSKSGSALYESRTCGEFMELYFTNLKGTRRLTAKREKTPLTPAPSIRRNADCSAFPKRRAKANCSP
jgi:hypothetical protein